MRDNRNPATLAAGRASETFAMSAERSEDSKASRNFQADLEHPIALRHGIGDAKVVKDLDHGDPREAPRNLPVVGAISDAHRQARRRKRTNARRSSFRSSYARGIPPGRRRLPARKVGGRWCASRAGLQKFFADLVAGEVA